MVSPENTLASVQKDEDVTARPKVAGALFSLGGEGIGQEVGNAGSLSCSIMDFLCNVVQIMPLLAPPLLHFGGECNQRQSSSFADIKDR